MENLDKIQSDILSKIKNVSDKNSYETIKTEIFGKKGIITELFKKIGSLNQDQRKEYASKLNFLLISNWSKSLSFFSRISVTFVFRALSFEAYSFL